MNRLLSPLLMGAVLVLSAPAAAETRSLSGFTSVNVADRVTVEIISGQAYSVEVTGSDAHRVRTRLEGRTLRITDANRPWLGEGPKLDAHIRITAPTISGVSAARGADVDATINGRCNALEVAASMGGEADVAATGCATVDASAAMGGIMTLAGSCRAMSASASMGGLIRAESMQCETVDASASMGGDVRAFASRSYDASAAMGGAINVAGNPASRDVSTSLGGEVSDR
jgi:hypothetical protein